ncbi:type VI secretion system tube protein TssD [Asticcacaulis sp. AC402]|uniref:type VI secretion system tube protein TssD n=1 Tax=Asticcacaulis sp. AC402 TaxID=1282361 RepID=UPI0003C3CA10|nr:type VI secretion system tube protein TssD [Asticcacaulis sp. AC402]ESQ76729.1 hypothetical protein ABAC402_03370 [Asticcacaulis sp. AC402]
MRKWAGVLVIMAGMVMSTAAAADAGFLQIKGSKQGEIKGDVTAKGKEGLNTVIAFDYSAPGASTRRFQPPVTFTLRWSKATPMLVNAAVNGEVLSQFKYTNWSTLPSGIVGHTATLEFSGAKITSVNIHDRTGDSDAVEPVVDITISYQKMTITHVEGSITADDDWGAK